MTSLSQGQIQYMETHASDDRAYQIIVSNTVGLFLSYTAVAARLWARKLSDGGYGLDDLLSVVALLIFTGYATATYITTYFGMGKHIIFVTDPQGFAQSVLAGEVLYNFTIPTIKLSILLLYGRIFPQKWFRKALWALGALTIAYSTAQILGDVLQCIPLSKLWDPTVPGTCISIYAVIMFGGIITIVTDFVMLSLPIPLLWNLKVSRTKKRTLTAVFTIGVIACVASIVRLYYAVGIGSSDPSYEELGAIICSTVEIMTGIIAACIPTYRPLLNRLYYGHVNARSTAWPSRRNQSEQYPIKLPNNSGQRSVSWTRDPIRADTELNAMSLEPQD